jgi:hypothetical protein
MLQGVIELRQIRSEPVFTACGKRLLGTPGHLVMFNQIVQMLLSLNSLVQGISQGIFHL